MPVGGCGYFAYGGVANAPGRIIDDALEGFFIIRIYHQTEVGNDILYLLPLIKGHSSIDAIGNASFTQGFFKNAALRIGAVQHGKVCPHIVVASLQLAYFVDHNVAFFHIAIGLEYADGVSLLFLRKYLFSYLPLVFFYNAVGRRYDGLRRAVVLLQFEDLGVGIYFGEIQNIVDICPTEGVYTLCIIAHYAYMPLALR